jgi:4-hydroxy-tetrahydrodipicolinate synthase
MTQMIAAALRSDWLTARSLNALYFPLMQANFLEPSPSPIKAVLSILGRCSDTVRLPMVPVSDATRSKLQIILDRLGQTK